MNDIDNSSVPARRPSVCARCDGTGREGKGGCPRCHGFGVGLTHGPYFLYYGRRLDHFALHFERLRRLSGIGIDFLLILAGFGGVVGLAVNLYDRGNPWLVLAPEFWLTPNVMVLGFFVGLGAAMFFFYRFYRRQLEHEKRAVLPHPEHRDSFDDLPAWDEPMIWDEAVRLPKRQRINASLALDEPSSSVVARAYQMAHTARSESFSPLHVFGGLMGDNDVAGIFFRLGVTGSDFRTKYLNLIRKSQTDPNGPLRFGGAMSAILDAWVEAYDRKAYQVRTADLLLAVAKADRLVSELLSEFGIDLPKLEHAVAWLRINRVLRRRYERYSRAAGSKPKGTMDRAMTAVATPYLDRVSLDLTSLAASAGTELVVSRQPVYDLLFRVIESGKRGIVLVGPHGTGKDSIIEGLAQLMVEEIVPLPLQDKRLVSIRLTDVISGVTGAEAEQRLVDALGEAAHAGNVVVAVSGIASSYGISAGREGALDLASVFASEVSDLGLFAICTATPEEYVSYIEGTRLGQTLTRLDVPPLDVEETIRALEAKVGSVEARQKVVFSYDAIEASAQLADRYLQDSAMPEKAISLMGEAAAAARSARGSGSMVNREDVAGVVAERTGVPLRSLTSDETDKLLRLEDDLLTRVIGQDYAVRAVSAAMRRARADLRDRRRPIANFLFLGPTGVGKTELTKALTELYFGRADMMIRLDMSEFQEQSSVGRLIGESNSRVGGQLTEAVRHHPSALILLDEIEKAHPDVLNIFLQVMDEARLTDGSGRTVDFREAIIIATSNAGADFIQDAIRAKHSVEAIREGLMRDKLRGTFRPEFLNRFDDVIVFSPLDESSIRKIAAIMLSGVVKGLEEKGIELVVTDEALGELAHAGYDPEFGARPLRRVIQDRLENAIADVLLRGMVNRRDRIIVEGGLKLRVEKAESL